MKLSYDLIIIGGSLEAIFSAEYAVNLGARIGLIIPNNYDSEAGQNLLIYQLGINLLNHYEYINPLDLLKEKQLLITEKYLPQLEQLGVDIIFSQVRFAQNPNLILKTEKYTLQANSYLLATSSQFFANLFNYQSSSPYLTVKDLMYKISGQNLPENIVIIGDDLITINLAQILTKLKKQITIITEKNQLLSSEDEDISFAIQANLEAQGIKILTNSPITQIKLIDHSKWLQAGNKAIETDEIILTKINSISGLNNFNKNQETLGLEKLGIDLSLGKIKVNNKLQSSHAQIYACGDLLGGYNLPSLAQYETKIAIENALFFNRKQVDYYSFPYHLPIQPAITRIGYTEKQARAIYGDNLSIIKFRLTSQLYNFLQDKPATLIKIILDDHDYIIGSHFFNLDSQEIIIAISQIIKQNQTIKFLFKFSFCDNYSREIINQIYQVWVKKYRAKNTFLTDLIETFLLWKRS